MTPISQSCKVTLLFVSVFWSRFSYLITGADVNSIFQEVEDFVNVSRPGSPKKTGVAVRLDNKEKKTERNSVRKSHSNIPLKCPLKRS